MILLIKKLIIYSEQAFLEDEEGSRLQTIPTEELIAEDRVLTAQEFDCGKLIIFIEDGVRIRGGSGCEIHARGFLAKAFAVASDAEAYAEGKATSSYADAP